MSIVRIPMPKDEIVEGYRAGIPEQIISKMTQGYELTEKEKDIVKSRGKVYVLGHTKDRGQTRIKPQLRDLPGGKKIIAEISQNRNELQKLYNKYLEIKVGLDSDTRKKIQEEFGTISGYIESGKSKKAKSMMEDLQESIKEETGYVEAEEKYRKTSGKKQNNFSPKLYRTAYDLIDDKISRGKWEIDEDTIVESLMEEGYDGALAYDVVQDYWRKENPED